MEKKLVVLTAMLALSAGLVFAQTMEGTEPAADATANTEMNAEMTNSDMNADNAMTNEAAPEAPAAPAENAAQ
jgi:hypothetical protein